MSTLGRSIRRLYLFWTLIHVFFFLISEEKSSASAIAEFWPIQNFSNLRYDYDYTELITYVIIVPLVLYGIYRIIRR